jgi:hypothetical protein
MIRTRSADRAEESAVIERLIECATCSRHVKSCDAACPFCHAPMRAAPARTHAPYGRLAAGAAVAASVATVVACTTYVQAPSAGRGVDPGASLPPGEGSGSVMPAPSGVVFYGSAGFEPFDASVGRAPPRDAATDARQDAIADDATDSDADDAALTDAATDSDAGDATDSDASDASEADGD